MDIPPLAIRVVTVLVFLVGLACGYWYRGWADRVKAQELLKRLEDHRKGE